MIYDDGNGRLKSANDLNDTPSNSFVGDIIYSHGLAILTDDNWAYRLVGPQSYNVTWESNHPIFISTFNCKVKDSEFNFTQNPTSTDSEGNIKDNLTGSFFEPYVTTIGLYNDSNELIGVGKLSRPIPKSSSTDMTFQVKLDF